MQSLKFLTKLVGRSPNRNLLSRIEQTYGSKIWKVPRKEFIRKGQAGEIPGFSMEKVGASFTGDILKEAAGLQRTAPGLHEVTTPTVTGKGTIKRIFFNDPGGRPVVASTIAKFPGSDEWSLVNLARDIRLPSAATREAVDVVMHRRLQHGAIAAVSMTPGSASAFHRIASRLAIGDIPSVDKALQMTQNMVKRDVSTVTAGGVARGSANAGSRRMPNGGT